LGELGPRHDFIVLLTDLPVADCLNLARQQSRLGLIINSDGATLSLARLISSATIMAATDKRGRNLGALEVFLNGEGKWSTGVNYYRLLQDKQDDLERTERQIEQIRGRTEMVSRLGNMERRIEMLRVEIGELKQKLLGTPASFYTNTFYAMVPDVADDSEILALVEKTKQEVSDLGGAKAARIAENYTFSPAGYVGGSVCASCHLPATVKWRKTGHAAAYTTLVGKNRQYDFDCLPCHVTGIDPKNANQVLALSPKFRGVGCEACHGPGRAHAENPAVKPAPATEAVCRRCHVEEHDDHFDFGVDLAKIKCKR